MAPPRTRAAARRLFRLSVGSIGLAVVLGMVAAAGSALSRSPLPPRKPWLPRARKVPKAAVWESDEDQWDAIEAQMYDTWNAQYFEDEEEEYEDLLDPIEAIEEQPADLEVEQDDNSLDRAGQRKLNFGKHRGKTFKEVFETDMPYCIWAVCGSTSSGTSTNFRPFMDYVTSRDPSILEDMSHTMPLGAYSRIRYEQILRDDPAFCSSVLSQVEDEPERCGLARHKFAAWLQQNAPQIKSGPSFKRQVDFGKYKGKAYEEVLEADLDYCTWVLGNRKPWDLFTSWLRKKMLSDERLQVLSAGKYKGWSFADICTKDPGYCEWVRCQYSPSGSLHNFKYYLEARFGDA